MADKYCTRAELFAQIPEAGTVFQSVTDEMFDVIIEQATEEVKHELQGLYDIDSIVAPYPQSLVIMTAIRAGLIFTTRFNMTDSDRRRTQLEADILVWKRRIANGSIRGLSPVTLGLASTGKNSESPQLDVEIYGDNGFWVPVNGRVNDLNFD